MQVTFNRPRPLSLRKDRILTYRTCSNLPYPFYESQHWHSGVQL